MSYLNGCCYQPDGLGFAAAALAPVAAATGPLAPAVMAFAAAASFLPAIHFGAGRKEADQIVPEQNKLADILTQADALARNQTLSADDIRQVLAQLRGSWEQFLEFIYQDSFTADGDTRASDQARATMEPQMNARLQGWTDMLNKLLGRPNPPTLMQSGGAVANLEFRTSSDLALPQAGRFTPGSTPPAGPSVIAPVQPDNSDLLIKLAVAGGLVLLLSRR